MSGPQMRSPAPRANAEYRASRSSFAERSNNRKYAKQQVDFAAVNRVALSCIGAVLARLLPGGRVVAGEYLALNPRRADTRLGSFKVRMIGPRAGIWCDFALGDKGGDIVSLVAYLEGLSQGEAARRLARMLGVAGGGCRNG
jgi:hypothetical protein